MKKNIIFFIPMIVVIFIIIFKVYTYIWNQEISLFKYDKIVSFKEAINNKVYNIDKLINEETCIIDTYYLIFRNACIFNLNDKNIDSLNAYIKNILSDNLITNEEYFKLQDEIEYQNKLNDIDALNIKKQKLLK